ncbi:MAG: DUF1015 family protein [Candidatus Limnocylindrales bacterium]
MPIVTAFRGLRYDRSAGDAADLISPPYDVIGPAEAARLAARDPHNSVRLDLPQPRPGEPSDSRYGQAAADLAAWQAAGVLVRDPRPAVYAYEQRYRLPGVDQARTRRGFIARLGLEPFRPGGPVRPHERTLGEVRADRLALLRATGANLSPIIGLYRTDGVVTAEALAAVMAGPADVAAVDDLGVQHRLWVVPVDDLVRGAAAQALLAGASAGPITIADGHHRYVTALTHHGERPEAATVMALLFDLAATSVTTLPTHRLVRGEPAGPDLMSAAGRLFQVDPCSSAMALLAAMAAPPTRQRLGVYSRGLPALLIPRRAALEPLLDAGASAVARWLDVAVLGTTLAALLGLDAAAVAAGAVTYTSDAEAAIAAVDAGEADTAFLLDATPVDAVLAVAEAGGLMPQKSTYFTPKPASGLVLDPGGA